MFKVISFSSKFPDIQPDTIVASMKKSQVVSTSINALAMLIMSSSMWCRLYIKISDFWRNCSKIFPQKDKKPGSTKVKANFTSAVVLLVHAKIFPLIAFNFIVSGQSKQETTSISKFCKRFKWEISTRWQFCPFTNWTEDKISFIEQLQPRLSGKCLKQLQQPPQVTRK